MNGHDEFSLDWNREISLRETIIEGVYSAYQKRNFTSEKNRIFPITHLVSDTTDNSLINMTDESVFLDIMATDMTKRREVVFFFISIDLPECMAIKPTYWDMDLLAMKYVEWVQQKKDALQKVQDGFTKKNMEMRLSLTNTTKQVFLSCFRPGIKERFKNYEAHFNDINS